MIGQIPNSGEFVLDPRVVGNQSINCHFELNGIRNDKTTSESFKLLRQGGLESNSDDDVDFLLRSPLNYKEKRVRKCLGRISAA